MSVLATHLIMFDKANRAGVACQDKVGIIMTAHPVDRRKKNSPKKTPNLAQECVLNNTLLPERKTQWQLTASRAP